MTLARFKRSLPASSGDPVPGMAVWSRAEAPAGFPDESVPGAGAEAGPAAARRALSIGAGVEGRLTCRRSPQSAGLLGLAARRASPGSSQRPGEPVTGPPPPQPALEPQSLAQWERLGGGAVPRERVRVSEHRTQPRPV